MKIKNLVFCGFMGSILAIGAATAAAPDVTIADTDATTLATAKYVKQGVNYALHHAGDKVSVASGSALTKSAVDTDGTYTLGLTMGSVAENDTGLVTGGDVAAAIAEVNGAADELAEDVAANTAAIAAETQRATGVEAGLQSAIDAIEEDYLKSSDITGTYSATDATHAMNGVAVASAISEANDTLSAAITAEKNRATGVENGLDTRIKAFEANGAHDVAALEARVDTAEDDIDALEEVVGDSESGLVKGVADNAAAITAEETRATGVEAGLQSAIDALDEAKQDKLTAGNGISLADDTVTAVAATNGGVVVDTNGISLSHTQNGAMYYNGTSWENLAITSSDFPN